MKAAENPGVPRTNWSGNYRYSTDSVLEPASVAEVQDAVRSGAVVRALGTRHCFNSIADSQVAQISTLKLKDVELDAEVESFGTGICGSLSIRLDTQYRPDARHLRQFPAGCVIASPKYRGFSVAAARARPSVERTSALAEQKRFKPSPVDGAATAGDKRILRFAQDDNPESRDYT